MDIRIISLKGSNGIESFCLSVDGIFKPSIYLDRDHAMDAGRLLIPDFDKDELGFDRYEAMSSDGFPPGFRPYRWVRGRQSLGTIVWGPSGMVSRGFDKISEVRSVCDSVVAGLTANLSGNLSSTEISGPKGP